MSRGKERFSPFVKQCFVTCAVCFNSVGQGCAAGFPGVLLPQLKQSGDMQLTKEAESWIASALAISIFFGNMATPTLMGRFGRKAAAYAAISASLLGWIVLVFAPDVTTLFIGRFIHGISFGIIVPLRQVLIAEYTSPKNRGSFLTTISLSQTIGIGLVHLIGSIVKWQYTALACASFPLLSLLLTLYSPESPSWLALRGDYDKCRAAFRWLRGEGEEEELNKMIETRIAVKETRSTAAKTTKLQGVTIIVKKKEVYKPVILAIHVYLLPQFSGALILTNYSTQVIGTLIGSDHQNLWMVELDVLRLIANILAVFVIARIQRRTMLFGSCALCLLSLLGISSYAYIQPSLPPNLEWVAVLFLNLQMASIGFGMVPMANVIVAEIFPLEYRSILGTVSAITVAVTMFLVLKTFPGLIVEVGLHGTYMVYFCIVAYGFVVTWFLLPETKGRTLQDIEEHFRGIPLIPIPETKPLKEEKGLEAEGKV